MKSIVGIFKGFTRKSAVENLIPAESIKDLTQMDYRELRRESAKEALRKMMSNGYFDICTIDKIIKTNQLILGPEQKEAYDILHNLHCVHYKNMSQVTYRALPSLMGKILNAHSAETMFDEEEPDQPMANVTDLLEYRGER